MVAILFVTDNLDSDGWGTGTGSPLTAEQIDTNFFNLKVAVEDLVENPPTPFQIQSIVPRSPPNENIMRITLSDGITFFDVEMPEAVFNFRGTYEEIMEESDPRIALYDFFTAEGGLYMALQEQEEPATEFNAADANEAGPFYKFVMADNKSLPVHYFKPGLVEIGLEESDAVFCYNVVEDCFGYPNFGGSIATLETPYTEGRVFPIWKNGGQIGTLSFEAEEVSGVFAVGESELDFTDFQSGDQLLILSPASDSESESELTSEESDLTVSGRGLSVTFFLERGTAPA